MDRHSHIKTEILPKSTKTLENPEPPETSKNKLDTVGSVLDAVGGLKQASPEIQVDMKGDTVGDWRLIEHIAQGPNFRYKNTGLQEIPKI